ncbi:phage terminase large subunit [Sphingobium sp. H39-3-25]|uniref:phage terminase large subunit n=1 Tax=Sphingobium arseniciresistens TaxID=3030834 RepID=UPI0023B8CD05|nr:phage terminase large subunit [Sphingobium arseniciresistens]
MKLESQFSPIPIQQKALDLARSTTAKNILYFGGGGSGKSIAISHIILMRGMNAPGSRHGIFRKTATSCRRTLFDLAFRDAMEMTFPGILADTRTKINETEMTIELGNGSIFFFAGLDSHNITRIMGDKFATIWLNECDEFDYGEVTKLKSRLRDVKKTVSGRELPLRMFYDLNPDLKSHFSYQCFILKNNPARNVPLRSPEDWVSLQMNVSNTDTHLGSDYLEDLMDGSEADVQRYVHGYWRDEREYSMFKPSDVNAHRVVSAPDNLVRVVVSVDPAASSNENSDETGIAVVGQGADGELYVLADYSTRGSPETWAKAVVSAYTDFSADLVVAEKNNGGDMVERNMAVEAPYLPIKLVHASKGKVIRAEPISTLYSKGRVHHVGEFSALEQQMYKFHVDYDRRKDGSPDRLDALVWGLSELTGEVEQPKRGRSLQLTGFWSA